MSTRIDGVVLLDKPAGMSSQGAVTAVKRAFNAEKAGVAQVKFGSRTDTGDAEGNVIEELPLPFFENESALQTALDAVLSKFSGAITQVPPMYSALERDGKPLYEYARAGVELERTPREITFHKIRWTNVRCPQATLEVSCSKSTYIRVLAEDIGNTGVLHPKRLISQPH
ncbi:hypothetical protein [Polynucleobacter necessarius]|uniref:hypothetical protein n=1 Tax=Polynucleobacter necessarius TaxID=576610 RepID=UPI001E5B916A|nr:hypothetical protein [Polynucleobacter necessarius]